MDKFRKYLEDSVGKTQCNPAVFILFVALGLFVVMAANAPLVVSTAERTATVCGLGLLVVGIAVTVRSVVRSRRAARPAVSPVPATLVARDAMPTDMAAAADHLARPEVELVLSSAGEIEQS